MAEVQLKAEKRTAGNRSANRTTRREGKVPGIYYVHGEDAIPIVVDSLALRPVIYTSEAHIVSLLLGDEGERKCILREVQFDPVTDRIVHFDLMGLRAGEKLRLEVPVLLEGTAVGVRDGGIVQHTLHRIEVECLPADLPEHITVNIEKLHIGDSIHVGDIQIANVLLLVAPEQPIVSITHARVVAETAAAPVEGEAAPAEPEVIAKGKKEEEEGK